MKSNRRFLCALAAACRGIRTSFESERNFKVHSVCAVFAIFLGILLEINPSEWLWISLAILLVLAAELFNTALEALTDLSSPSYHELAKKAKDAAAAGVLMAAIFSLICGIIVFLPKLVQLINS